MKKSDLRFLPLFFDKYIHLADDIDLIEGLEKRLNYTAEEVNAFTRLGDVKYAEDKWTVKDILQHIIDCERIQSYRALVFARQDKNVLPGFDEVLYASTALASKRTVPDLLDEFQHVRKSSIHLFKNLSEEALHLQGTCYSVSVSVLALGFVLVGHQLHHLNVIKEKYYPFL